MENIKSNVLNLFFWSKCETMAIKMAKREIMRAKREKMRAKREKKHFATRRK